MKLSKLQFKKILKECIRELIGEGAFDNVVTENLSNHVPAQQPRRAANDFVSSFGGSLADQAASYQTAPYQAAPYQEEAHTDVRPNSRLDELTKMTAAQCAHGDPSQAAMMESIFADTARTTLQERLAAEGGGGYARPVDPQQDAREMAQLEQLTGGHGTGHWAALAFGKYSKE